MAEKPVDEQVVLFKTAFDDFIMLADAYPDALQNQVGITDEWSARDVIAHINGWLVECTRRLPRFAQGTGNIQYNHDAFNAVSLWLRADRAYQQLLDEMRDLVAQIVQFIDELNDFYKQKDERYSQWLRVLTHEAETHGHELHQFLDAQRT